MMDRQHKRRRQCSLALIICVTFLSAPHLVAENQSRAKKKQTAATAQNAPQTGSTQTLPAKVKAATARIVRRLRGTLDLAAPASRIDSPAPGSNLPVGVATTIAGTALDFGGGSVSRVEVSFDGGKSWLRAQGTDRWKFAWTPATAGQFNVLSRATDDSGNVERPLSGLSVMTTVGVGRSARLTATTSSVTPPPPGGGCGRYGCSDTTAADFQTGSSDNCAAVAHCHDELILKPAMGVDFAALPADWLKVEPPLGGGSVTINNGQVVVENAYAHSLALYNQPRAIKFGATFTGPNQRAGAGITFDGASWARFSTDATGTKLFAQSTNGLDAPASTEVTIANAIGQPHKFRIEWTNAAISYFVDGVSVGPPHSTLIGNDMRPVVRDDTADGRALSVDWMRLSPYEASGTFHSRIFDRGSEVLWTTTRSKRVTPAGTTIQLCARAGNTPVPDATWSPFKCQTDLSAPTSIGERGRYAQYRATLTGTQSATPELVTVQQDINPCDAADCNDLVDCTTDTCEPVANPDCLDPNDPISCPEPFFPQCNSTPGLCADSTFCNPQFCDEFQGCVPGPAACPPTRGECVQVTCNNTTGTCDEVAVNAACEDFNPCTVDSCNPVSAMCSHSFASSNTVCRPSAGACDVADKCSGSSATCPTADAKSNAVCRAAANQCDLAETCNGTSNDCPLDSVKTCTDNKACTDDTCNPSTGCVFTNNTNPCSDGNACTENDTCNGGSCTGTTKTCTDYTACTTDTCSPASGCVFTNNTNPCSDGKTCTVNDSCQSGQCVGTREVKYTGGGQFTDSSGSLWSGGFNAKTKSSPSDKEGEFNANNHVSKKHINGPVSNIRCGSLCGAVDDDGITFDVMDKKTGVKYTVQLKDGGKHNDWIQIDGPETPPAGVHTDCRKTDRGEVKNHRK